MSTAVAKVAFLQGQAWVKAPDGTLRALTVGSTLNNDDILVTAQGSRVELDVGNGEPLVVNGGVEVGMSRDFLADTATEADEALLSDASVQEALTVLEQGGDLLDELEETAAGDNTSGDSDGSSFVRLSRIVEGTGSQSFGYDSSAAGTAGTPENDADYINRAPLVTDQALTSNEDEVLTGQVLATDIEGDSITYALISAPANGTLLLDPITGQFTFTPNANYNGTDSFVVTVTDSRGNASTTTISLNILPVNDAPTTNDINLTTDEDVPVNGQVVAEDIEGDTLTYTVSGQPANGSVVLDPATGTFVYTPNSDYNGSDVFIVTVDDGNGGTTTSTVRIGINPVNDVPVSSDQNLITPEDTPIDGQVVATDVDGDTLGYSVSGQPTNGVVVLNPATGGFTYSPNANYNGSDSFVVTIDDGNGGTTTSLINIGVTPVNDAPVSSDQNLITPEDTPINGQVVATDVDGDTLGYSVSGQPTSGVVVLNSVTGGFTYSPNANYNGSDSFVVTIDDGNGGTTTSRINIGVTPVNDAPVASNLNLTTPEDTPISSQISASDVDGDSLTFTVSGAPGNGSVSLNPATGSFTYSPNSNYNGSDSFVVTISDGNGGITTSLVNIGVTPVNDAPIASNQNLTTPEDIPISGAISASDPDGDTLTYSVSGSPANGSVVLNLATGGFTYTPNAAYNGSDSFVVTISDGQGGTTTSTVNIGVTPVAPTTVSSVTSPSVTEGADLVYDVTLSGPATSGTSLVYSLGGGSASAADYSTATFSNGVTLVGGNLIIPTGVSSFTVTVPTVDDAIAEVTETLPLSVGGVAGTGSILDNDPAPKITGMSVQHATEGANLVCTVTLDQVLGAPYTLPYSIGGGTASSTDYGTPIFSNGVTVVGGNLLLPAGISSFSITLPTVDDTLNEPTETVPFTFGGLTINGNIYDNDAAPSVSIDNVSVNETDGTATFTVSLSAASGRAISVDYTSSNGSATAGSDYASASGTLSFAAGDTSKTITVNITDDNLFEGNENFFITLNNPTNATLGTAVGTGTIVDNDSAPTVSGVSSPSVIEGGDLVYNVVLSNPSTTVTSLAYSLGGGSAVAADIGTVTFSNSVTLSGGNLIIPAGVTSFTVTVATVDDLLSEPTETLPLSVGGVTGTGSIIDNDSGPSLSINSVSVNEADSTATFTVTLSAASGQAISVDYTSANGTAVAGSDYTAVSGTLSFVAGETSKVITVPITNDNLFEGNENFTITLSNPSNAVIGTATGTGTIVDNDSVPTVSSISSPSVTEGGDLVYNVVLSNPSTTVTSLAYSLGGGSAVAADIGTVTFSNSVTLSGGNLIIPAGVTSFTVTVATVDDLLSEPTETLPLSVGGVTGTGSIIDNDSGPSLSINSVSVNEADSTATFTVTLSAASGQAISVDYTSANGTAVAGSDYTAVSGTLSFVAGETSKVITVPITNDNLFEGNENFTITLSNPSNAVIGTATGTGTIVDNDSVPTVSSISSPSVTEGGDLVYNVVLSNPSTTVTSLAYSLGGGSAVAADIGMVTFSNGVTLDAGNLIIPAGVTTFSVTVLTVDDAIIELTETLPLTIGGVTATGSIIDNDAPPNAAPDAIDDPVNSGSSYSVQLGDASPTDLWTTPDSKGQAVVLSGYNTLGASASLYIGTVDGNANSLGVSTSPRTGGFVPDQIEYDMVSGKSESLLMNFNGNLTQASFSVSRLYPGENGGEIGAWEAYYNGQVVASGYFRLPGGSDKGSFTINTGGIVFNSIRFASLQTTDGTGDGGDYFLTSFQGSGAASVNSSYMVSEGGTKTVGSAATNRLLANDTDPDGDSLTVTHINGVAITDGQTLNLAGGSSLTIHSDGSFSFATNSAFDYLNAGQVATKSFTYTISDGKGGADTATATMTVVGAGAPTWLKGTSGNDSLTGTFGNDLIEGGAGSDSLLGSLGADTFKWSLSDKGSVGAPVTDNILDFSKAQGDSINVADLLQGENSGNLTNYMHFTYNSSANQTTLHISSGGGYSGGFTAASTDQIIVLNGLSVSGTDAAIINQLKAAGNLITD